MAYLGGTFTGPGQARGGTGDRGSATAELAAALPALTLLLLASLAGVSGVATKLRCIDAARDEALAVARGEASQSQASRVAPDGADIDVHTDGDLVRVVVRVQIRPLGPKVPGITVEGEAIAAMEPSE